VCVCVCARACALFPVDLPLLKGSVFLSQRVINPAVRRIVEGETKFSKNLDMLRNAGDNPPPSKDQDLKQWFLAMTEEVQTLWSCSNKLQKLSKSMLDVYRDK
jgi:hypothetical protein